MSFEEFKTKYYSLINEMKKFNENDRQYFQIGMELVYLAKDHPKFEKKLDELN